MIRELMNFFRNKYRIDCAVRDVNGTLIVGVNEYEDDWGEIIGDVEWDTEILGGICNYEEITDDMEYEELLHIFDMFDEYSWEFFKIPATLINL